MPEKGRIKNSYWFQAGSYIFLSRILETLLGTLNFFILIRILPVEYFGNWVLYISILAIVEMFRVGLIRTPLIMNLSNSSLSNVGKIQFSSLLLNLIFTSLVSLAIVFSASALENLFNSQLLYSVFIIGICKVILFTFLSHSESLLHLNYKFKAILISSIISRIIFSIILISIYFTESVVGIETLAWIDIFITVIGLLLLLWFSKSFFKIDFSFRKQYFLALFHYGKFTMGTNLNSMVFRNIDSWMLGSLLSPTAVAIYNPAIRISNIVEVPTTTISTILLPKLINDQAKNRVGNSKYLYERSVALISAIIIPIIIVLVMMSDYVIDFVAGDEYAESARVLQITLFYGLFVPFIRQFGIVLDGIGKANINFYFVSGLMSVNIIYNIIFINLFGIPGAAFATLLGYISGFIYSQIYLKRFLDVQFINIIKNILEFYNLGFSIIFKYFRKTLRKVF